MIEIRWHGRGGQGAFTASKILGAAASLFEAKYALSFPSFGPERRGAPIQAFTKIDSKPIINRSEIKLCDYIVYLDETLFDIGNVNDLKSDGKIIVNSPSATKYKDYKNIVAVNAESIAMDILKMPITNTAMLAALVGVSEILSINSIVSAVANYLPCKVVDRNIDVIKETYKLFQEVTL